MTSSIDDLVAGLNPVRDDDITSEPSGAGARTLLAAITAAASPAPRRRRLPGSSAPPSAWRRPVSRPPRRFSSCPRRTPAPCTPTPTPPCGSTWRTARTRWRSRTPTPTSGSSRRRSPRSGCASSSASCRCRHRTNATSSASAHCRRLPGSAFRPGVGGTVTTVLKCPPGQDACPLKVRLSGPMFRSPGGEIVIGRKARPGEVYGDAHPARGDHPKSLRLTGRTVGQALADLRARGSPRPSRSATSRRTAPASCTTRPRAGAPMTDAASPEPGCAARTRSACWSPRPRTTRNRTRPAERPEGFRLNAYASTSSSRPTR